MANSLKKIIEFLHYCEGLKKVPRKLHLSSGEVESTAEHSWRMAFMVMFLAPKLRDIQVDVEKSMKMALIHDLIEIDAKDVCFLDHIDNPKLKKDKQSREEMAMNRIQEMLGPDAEEIASLWREYEDQLTVEARFVKAIDKLEGRLQYIEDQTTVYKEETQANKFPKARETVSDLCSIDSLLAELDRMTVSKRKHPKPE
ncbi:HD domain-containing protein [candidate division WS5 bacterium]|uniref:5'-deoxynucleotidase n=1 Tax=candidate division WS5 bacterium TaxID=2093353 RepID=A0A419DF49_9BACT|nr:MAG: HD domain-containing protein [candidate division WS5 bacterium]